MLLDCRVSTDIPLFFNTFSQRQLTLNFVGVPQVLTPVLIDIVGFVLWAFMILIILKGCAKLDFPFYPPNTFFRDISDQTPLSPLKLRNRLDVFTRAE